MRIEAYDFGRIVVAGETYTRDVVIGPGAVKAGWWRREGHRLDVADLDPVLEWGPETPVVGTGYYGNMAVPEATLAYLEDKGVAVRVARTTEAVALYNELGAEPGGKVVAGLHLTC